MFACGLAYLSIGQLENQRDLLAVDVLLLDLGGHPAFGDIGLPRLGADIIRGCHVGPDVLVEGGTGDVGACSGRR